MFSKVVIRKVEKGYEYFVVMQKAKKYDWKDSNMTLFGSDTDKAVKKESAEKEPAWQGSGGKVGLRIWRIVKFKVTDWPKEDYGKFYGGDSYIVLNTYKHEGEDELQYDLHFWIGKYSTQDEYGTAAYKTVELDTFLDDKPVQHREVEGHESKLFKSYFGTLEILKGGADTGFRRVLPEVPPHRLFHFCGSRKSVEVREVTLSRNILNSVDVFILDLGTKIYQFNGSDSNKDEKFKAVQYIQQLKSERGGRVSVEVLDENDTSKSHEFYDYLKDEAEADDEEIVKEGKELFRLSDSSGQTEFKSVKNSDISIGDFKSEDVFILDTRKTVFVWVGKGASLEERRNSLSYASNYLNKTDYPFAAITVIPEGRFNEAFDTAISA